MRRFLLASAVALSMLALTTYAQYQAARDMWLEPNSGVVLSEFNAFDDTQGTLGVLNATGEMKTDGHPFFTPLGTNGRACVSCHQPAWSMSVSISALTDR